MKNNCIVHGYVCLNEVKGMNLNMEKRNFLIDNCKAISIFFVVFAHFLENFAIHNNYLLLVIYTFHMPLFVFFSGYLAKYDLKKMINNILIPYVTIQIISYFFYLKFDPINFYLFNAYTSLWYMISLFSWYCLTNVLDIVKKPIIFVILSILFALLIGYDASAGTILSLSRTIVYFPIFASGYFFKKYNIIKWDKSRKIHKIVSLILFLLLCVVIHKFMYQLELRYFFGSYGYFNNYNHITRFLIYISNFIGIYFFISWVPNKKMFISKIGRNTISVYLFHYIIIRFLYYKNYINFYNHPTIVCFILACILTFVLSRDIIANIFKGQKKKSK